jgi:hypothetical protein
MADKTLKIKIDGKQVRGKWIDIDLKCYFATEDVVQVLTGEKKSPKDIKESYPELKSRWKDFSHAIKIKNNILDSTDLKGVFRIIQSIFPKKAQSEKAELAKKEFAELDTIETIKGYLNAIDRTHILNNDNDDFLYNDDSKAKEWEAKELVGLNTTAGNGLGKKGGNDIFMKPAVLDRLSTLAKRIVGNEKFVLEEFLVNYAKAYNILLGSSSRSFSYSMQKDGVKPFIDIFDYLFLDNEDQKTSENAKPKKPTESEIAKLSRLKRIDKDYRQVATISILIILKILPYFTGRGGNPNVSSIDDDLTERNSNESIIDDDLTGKNSNESSIDKDFKNLHDFCKGILEDKGMPDSLVPEMLLFKEINNNLKIYLNKKKYGNGKIIVFNFAYKLFNSISNHLDKERLYFMNKNRKQNGYSRYNIDGFWEEESSPYKLWEIKKIKKGPECHSEYIIRAWEIFSSNNNEKKTYKCSSYLLLFTDKSHAYVRAPKYVYYMIPKQKPAEIAEQKPTEIPDNDIKYIIDYLNVETKDEVETKDGLKPKELIFESEVISGSPLSKCLKRSEKSFHINGTPKNTGDYYFTPALHAVTHNAVYIKADEGSNFQYYRIPVNLEEYKSLSHIDLSDTAGIITIKETVGKEEKIKKYLAFFDQDIFINS